MRNIYRTLPMWLVLVLSLVTLAGCKNTHEVVIEAPSENSADAKDIAEKGLALSGDHKVVIKLHDRVTDVANAKLQADAKQNDQGVIASIMSGKYCFFLCSTKVNTSANSDCNHACDQQPAKPKCTRRDRVAKIERHEPTAPTPIVNNTYNYAAPAAEPAAQPAAPVAQPVINNTNVQEVQPAPQPAPVEEPAPQPQPVAYVQPQPQQQYYVAPMLDFQGSYGENRGHGFSERPREQRRDYYRPPPQRQPPYQRPPSNNPQPPSSGGCHNCSNTGNNGVANAPGTSGTNQGNRPVYTAPIGVGTPRPPTGGSGPFHSGAAASHAVSGGGGGSRGGGRR